MSALTPAAAAPATPAPFPPPPHDDTPGGREYLAVVWPAMGGAVVGAAVDFLAAAAEYAADPESVARAARARWQATTLCELYAAIGLFGVRSGVDVGALAGWLRGHPAIGPAIAAAAAARLPLDHVRETFARHLPHESLARYPTAARTATRFVAGYLAARARGPAAEWN